MQIDTTKFAVSGFARDLLDVADNLRRAIDSVPAAQRETSDLMKTLLEGIEATERMMIAAFEKNGVRKVAPTAGAFDPNHHEVMFEAEVPGKKAGEIIQLIEPGYMIHDRLLRPARVGVAKGDSAMPSAHSLDESV
jgi:molecular chaperone GrpE